MKKKFSHNGKNNSKDYNKDENGDTISRCE